MTSTTERRDRRRHRPGEEPAHGPRLGRGRGSPARRGTAPGGRGTPAARHPTRRRHPSSPGTAAGRYGGSASALAWAHARQPDIGNHLLPPRRVPGGIPGRSVEPGRPDRARITAPQPPRGVPERRLPGRPGHREGALPRGCRGRCGARHAGDAPRGRRRRQRVLTGRPGPVLRGGGPPALRPAGRRRLAAPVFTLHSGHTLFSAERRLLSETTAGWAEKHPDVRLTHEVRVGSPVETLADAPEKALAVVVGRRGRGGYSGMRVGSGRTVFHPGGPTGTGGSSGLR